MNNNEKIMLFISSIFLNFVVVLFIHDIRNEAGQNQNVFASVELEKSIRQRQSISFILGEDQDLKNPFYENAEKYFRYNPEAKTDKIVTDCRSMQSLFSSLKNNYKKDQRPYQTINIIVHSNPWSGMSIPLIDGGERLDAKQIENALREQILIPLSNEIIDERTRIVIFACGMANNEELIAGLQKAFGGFDQIQPQIIASENYFNFYSEADLVFKSEMQVFYAFYPTAHKPGDLSLSRQLKKKYPEASINWLSALQNTIMDSNQEIFTYQYNIPVEWEVNYPEFDAPEIFSEEDKIEWLMNQDELISIIDKTQIPFDHFRWIVKQGFGTGNIPYIKVLGKVTVLCILTPFKRQV